MNFDFVTQNNIPKNSFVVCSFCRFLLLTAHFKQKKCHIKTSLILNLLFFYLFAGVRRNNTDTGTKTSTFTIKVKIDLNEKVFMDVTLDYITTRKHNIQFNN